MQKPLTLAVFLATAAFAEDPTVSPEALKGSWHESERGTTTEFFKKNDGLWYGKVVAADHKEDIGRMTFQKLVWNADAHTFVGTMLRPDADESVEVTVSLPEATVLKAVVRKFFLTKTLTLTKVR